MPRISKTTPVLLISATSRTPKMFSSVMLARMTSAMATCVWALFVTVSPKLLSSGISTSPGIVATTAVTVRTPAKR